MEPGQADALVRLLHASSEQEVNKLYYDELVDTIKLCFSGRTPGKRHL